MMCVLKAGILVSLAFILCPGASGWAADSPSGTSLPVQAIETIIQAQGDVSGGVFHIEIERNDIGNILGPRSVIFTPSFEIHGDLYFQPLPNGQAFLNGDLALKESEVNPFIAALIKNGLIFQAFHRHAPMKPQIWFVHFRGKGDPLALARKIKAAIRVTGTPFPQSLPSDPATPLDPQRLADILHGDATVGNGGVVTVMVLRTDKIHIDDVLVNPAAGISTTIEFKPLGGSVADVVPDFSMGADEVMPVVNLMLNYLKWHQGGLCNQETDEMPQLYFDHMVKVGNAYDLAKQIRIGLNFTDAE